MIKKSNLNISKDNLYIACLFINNFFSKVNFIYFSFKLMELLVELFKWYLCSKLFKKKL